MVGGIPTQMKNMKVNWDEYSQYMEKQKMFQTPNQPSKIKLGVLETMIIAVLCHVHMRG